MIKKKGVEVEYKEAQVNNLFNLNWGLSVKERIC